jgi:hypothetical protein
LALLGGRVTEVAGDLELLPTSGPGRAVEGGGGIVGAVSELPEFLDK